MDMEHRASKVDGFKWDPILDYIFVADYGQPDRSAGGILLGDFNFGPYRFDLWRYGEVIAIGPGRQGKRSSSLKPMPPVKLGDVVMFSRKHGTRLPGEVRFHHPTYKSEDGLLVRVLDPEKTVAVLGDFKPWWDPTTRQIEPGIDFSG